jgi:omega-6 fatty acid desaturase (delta-12 desaturase)
MGKGALGGAARTSENWRKVPAKDELSLSALRKSIPAELFERSTAHSLGYLAFDLASLWLTYRAAAAALLLLPGWLVFPAYALMQGMNLTALWVLGHECGHGGFTDHKLLNEVVGFCLHCGCGTPYHSWAASHAKHHRHTNDIVGGESWVPDVLPADGKLDFLQRFMASRFGGFFRALSVFCVGFHAYLLVNMTGDLRNMGQSHFVAAPPLFKRSMRGVFLLNNAALALVFGSVLRAVLQHGFGTTFAWVIAPHMVNMGFLTTLTFMQHTHPNVPHFAGEHFNWLRGAISTIDRSMGEFADWRLHRIVDSHVVHHVFPEMPFYNAKKATPYLAKALGQYHKGVDIKIWGSSFLGYWHEYVMLMGSAQVAKKSEKDGFFWFMDDSHSHSH